LIYSLLVLSSPAEGSGVLSAARFAEAVLARGHRIHRVFFLDNGAASGAATAVYPQDEDSPIAAWAALAERHALDLVLCVTSALRRGMLDAGEAARHERDAVTVHPAFSISGLGQLIDACAASDRVITFGG